MGRTTTPTYRIETTELHVTGNPMYVPGKVQKNTAAWRTHNGRPTAANIEKYVRAYIASCAPDGCNAHIGKSLGHLPVVHSACIVRQSTGEVVAAWAMPVFMAL